MTTPRTSSPLSQALTDLGERYFAVQHGYDPYNATLLGISDADHHAGVMTSLVRGAGDDDSRRR